jgi:hypothetical protein
MLNAQKQHGDKTRLGFTSKSKKNKKRKNKKKKKKIVVPMPPPTSKKFNEIYYDENGNAFEEEVREVVGNAKKAMPNHNNFVVLMMGMSMPNLSVHQMNMLHGLFGFQRPLLLTKEDPLRYGDLETRLDLL